MTQPGGFRIGQGVVEIVADRSGLRRQVQEAVREAGAGQHIDVPVRIDEKGFTRDINGRLHDARGRFVNEGRSIGSKFGLSLSESMAKSFRGSFSSFFKGLDFLPIPPAKFLALGAAIAPLATIVAGLASSLGLAAMSSAALAPALLGLGIAATGVTMAFGGVMSALKAHSQMAAQAGAAAGSSASAQASAARQIKAAQQALTDAQRDARDAQLALTGAREEARRALLDMQETLRDSVLDEEGAQLALARAQERATEVNADAKASALDRAEAAHDVRVAEDRLSDSTRERADMQAKASEMERAGVEGSAQVIAAKRRVEAADRRVADATEALSEATAAQTQAFSAGSAAASAYQQQIAKLSPAGRTFVETIIGMKESVDGLRRSAETAILPGFTAALISVKSLFPDLSRYVSDVGVQVGRAAASVGRLTETTMFRGQFRSIMAENAAAASNFADSATPMVRIFMTVSEASAQLVTRFSAAFRSGVEMLANWLDLKRESGALADVFQRAGDSMARWWSILSNTLVGLVNVLRAANPAGEQMAGNLEAITRRFAEWTGTDEGQKKMREFFDYIMNIDYGRILAIAGAVTAMGAAIKAMSLAQGAVGVVSGLVSLGPVGIAIIAVAAAVALLAGAFTYLYSTSQPAHDIINGIWRSFSENLLPVLGQFYAFVSENIIPVLRDGILYYLQAVSTLLTGTVFPALREAAEALLPIVEQAWARITKAFSDNRGELAALSEFLQGVAKFLWENVIPVLGVLAGALVNQFGTGVSYVINIVGFLVGAIRSIIDAIQFVYTAISPILTAIWAFISSILNIIIQVWTTAWTWIFDLVVLRFSGVFDFVSRVAGNIKDRISLVLDGIKFLWNSAWGWIHEKTSGWTGRLGELATSLKDNFIRIFKLIPVGIVGALNSMIDLVNSAIGNVNKVLPKSAEIPKLGRLDVPGYASGGMIRGPGTGTSDSVPLMTSMGPIMGSAGEFMIKARSTSGLLQDYGPRFLDWLNNYDVRRGDSSNLAVGPRRYASGGLVTRTQNWIREQDPKPYVLGSNGPGAWDCSSLVGGVWALLTGRDPNRRYFTTYTLPGAGGFKPGRGLYTIGLSREHVVGNLGGLAFEAANPADGIIVGSGATSVNAMPAQYYLPEMGEGFVGGGDGGGLFGDIAKKAIDKAAGEIRGRLPRPGGIADNIIAGLFDRTAAGLREIEFDSGGILHPGRTLVANRTGRRERVLDPAQTERWESSGGGAVYRFEAGSITLDASKIGDIEDLLNMIKGVAQTARQHGSRE